MCYLAAVSPGVTHSVDVHSPGAVAGGGQHVGAGAPEVEGLPVKRTVVCSAPAQTGGRPLWGPGAPQQPPPHQGGGPGVWGGETRRVNRLGQCHRYAYSQVCSLHISTSPH